ncbi:MAG: NAD(P)/FAD-dependent oxidoreductase [Armatimonadota bacterium]
MEFQEYDYIVVGGGLAAGTAVKVIRKLDEESSILLICREEHLPYERPPLSKDLWFCTKTPDQLMINNDDFYIENSIDVLQGTEVVSLNTNKRILTDSRRNGFIYEKLLLATGSTPRKLEIPGSDLDEVRYYRTLDDYTYVSDRIGKGGSVLVIGGGFTGTEMSAALHCKDVTITMLFDEARIMGHIFPADLSRELERTCEEKGITLIREDAPASFEKQDDGRIVTMTKGGLTLESDIIIVGIGATPETKLAEGTSITVKDGILVDKKLQTSVRNVYAAGDVACAPYGGTKELRRIDHWDSALHQGRIVGLNMIGSNKDYDYMPQFSSNLFDFSYEAVGDIDSSLEVFTDWKIENHTGVIYYMKDNRVRGVVACNMTGKMDDARKLLRSGKNINPDDLNGAIS